MKIEILCANVHLFPGFHSDYTLLSEPMNYSLCEYLLPLYESRGRKIAFSQQMGQGQYRHVLWQEQRKQILQLSSVLLEKGIKPGDKIILLSENCPEWSVAAFAAINIGAAIVPIAAISTAKELETALTRSRAKLCFFSESAQAYKDFNKELLPKYISWDITKEHPLEEILFDRPLADVNPFKCDDSQVAISIFTSGTTGNPKAVPLTNKNILLNALEVKEIIAISDRDVMVSVLPLSHMLEFTGGLLLTSICGIRVCYVKSFMSEDLIAAMRENRSTTMLGVPLLFEVMARNIQDKLSGLPKPMQKYFELLSPLVVKRPYLGKLFFPLIYRVFGGKLRFFVTGGTKLQPWVYDFYSKLGIVILQGYGLTETSPVLTFTAFNNTSRVHTGAPIRNITISIQDGEGNEVPQGEEGEICARGESIFNGYEDSTHNEGAFRGDWFRTGDLGLVDKDGNIHITGRIKEIIVSAAGKNIYPEEIEEQIKKTEKFYEASVLSLPDANDHEKVSVVCRPDRLKFKYKTEQELKTAITEVLAEACVNLADYKQPQRVEIYEEEFPKTHTRKVKRHELRKIILNQSPALSAGDVGEGLKLDDELHKVIAEKISALTNIEAENLRLDHHVQSDLGLDSLTFVELIGSLEKVFSVEIDAEELADIQTLGDLVEMLTPMVGSASRRRRIKRSPILSRFNPTSGMQAYWYIPRIVANYLVRMILNFFFPTTAQREAEYEGDCSYIFVPNHTSHFDTISILATLPVRRLKSTFAVAAKDYFFNSNWKSLFARLFINAIPFDRKRHINESMEDCGKILDKGGSLIIFPEGTRAPDGEIQTFKPGVGILLAERKNVKAVPVYIDGAFKVYPKGAALPKPGRIKVYYGTPIGFDNLDSSKDSYKEIVKRLENEVVDLKKKVEDSSSTDQSK